MELYTWKGTSLSTADWTCSVQVGKKAISVRHTLSYLHSTIFGDAFSLRLVGGRHWQRSLIKYSNGMSVRHAILTHATTAPSFLTHSVSEAIELLLTQSHPTQCKTGPFSQTRWILVGEPAQFREFAETCLRCFLSVGFSASAAQEKCLGCTTDIRYARPCRIHSSVPSYPCHSLHIKISNCKGKRAVWFGTPNLIRSSKISVFASQRRLFPLLVSLKLHFHFLPQPSLCCTQARNAYITRQSGKASAAM